MFFGFLFLFLLKLFERKKERKLLWQRKEEQYNEKLAKLVPLLEVLVEASDQVKLNISLGNLELAKGFLVAMQETAITLGTGLDSLIGENAVWTEI